MATSYHPPISPDDDDEEYTVVPVIPTDYRYHTDEHPECFEPDCDCHQQRIADLTQDYRDGQRWQCHAHCQRQDGLERTLP
jgi:hypothetical protein